MRVFESFLVLLLFCSPLTTRLGWQSSAFGRRKPSDSNPTGNEGKLALLRLYLGVLGVVLAIHLIHEGAHWQMAPAYLAIAILAALVLIPSTGMPPLGRNLRLLTNTFVLLLTITTCCFAAVIPMFQLPTPTGAYNVGTRIIYMTDLNRKEDAVGVSNSGTNARPNPEQREIVVQIWYPAKPSHNPRAPYRRRSETTLGSSYQSVDWTAARYDAPAADRKESFPLVLYNPGWNGRRTQNTALVEELASHGYVVAAIDHPYNSGPVQLQDGRVIKPVPSPELFDESSSKQALYTLIDREVEKETDDTLFALAKLARRNADPQDVLYNAMDLSKVATLGYSLGGAVAAESAYRSSEIRAVVDLDTPLYANAGEHGITQPFLFLGEDLPAAKPEELSHMSLGQRRDVEMDQDDYARQLPLFRRAGDYQISIRGTLHTSFQDGIFFSPIPSISGVGSIAPLTMNKILRQYTLAFLDHSLRGIRSPLLASATSPFSEVKVLFSPAGSGH